MTQDALHSIFIVHLPNISGLLLVLRQDSGTMAQSKHGLGQVVAVVDHPIQTPKFSNLGGMIHPRMHRTQDLTGPSVLFYLLEHLLNLFLASEDPP
ncbi:hypothetical protein FGADI_2325 [Fusarium gaditjirri]|uniref:Uncharacterized protein n=1 Tax=Fusarium gaditjirri TaxID=282569 RepID=A0A8H4TIB4_9HYPO|nr:hypothetical protein FGADI_2325 [Fusarium gaditjirri]